MQRKYKKALCIDPVLSKRWYTRYTNIDNKRMSQTVQNDVDSQLLYAVCITLLSATEL